MTLNFAKGCHPCLSVLGDVLFVPVNLSLAPPSGFPPECVAIRLRASVAAAATPWGPSQWREGSDLCGLVPFGRRATNEKLLYATIKQDKMGWLV